MTFSFQRPNDSGETCTFQGFTDTFMNKSVSKLIKWMVERVRQDYAESGTHNIYIQKNQQMLFVKMYFLTHF